MSTWFYISWVAMIALFLWGWSRWFHLMRQLDDDMDRILADEQERRDE